MRACGVRVYMMTVSIDGFPFASFSALLPLFVFKWFKFSSVILSFLLTYEHICFIRFQWKKKRQKRNTTIELVEVYYNVNFK